MEQLQDFCLIVHFLSNLFGVVRVRTFINLKHKQVDVQLSDCVKLCDSGDYFLNGFCFPQLALLCVDKCNSIETEVTHAPKHLDREGKWFVRDFWVRACHLSHTTS